MREVIGRGMGEKRRRLERECSYNQQQYRKRPYMMAAKLHSGCIIPQFMARELADWLEG